MAFNFTGKKILVTGAGRNIGRAIAIALWKSGCIVYALSRTKSTLDSLVEECPGIIPITQDLQNWDETRSKLEKLETLDGLVNNAAVFDFLAPALEWPRDQIDRYMSIIVYGAINCTQVFARKMVDANRSGAIVNIGGLSGAAAAPHLLGCAVAKAGLQMVTKQFAQELGPHNIRVNSVTPTLVMTDNVRSLYEAGSLPSADILSERSPMGRLPSVENVVQPVMYMLSEYASMVTGTTHVVDGGTVCNITTKQ